MDDSLLYKLESGVEIALSCAQSWSKYAKELTSYVERRINLCESGGRFHLNLESSGKLIGPKIQIITSDNHYKQADIKDGTYDKVMQ